jgi:hypothetical protein
MPWQSNVFIMVCIMAVVFMLLFDRGDGDA